MNSYKVHPAALSGHIIAPPSKSQTLRAILFAALAQGKSTIHQPLASPDAQAMIHACRLLGATIDVFPNHLEIIGTNGIVNPTEDVIDAGNSGIVLRFCAAIGALGSHPIVITGDASIRHQRPMQQLLHGLRQLGAGATSMRGDGYAPVIINGPLHAGTARLSGEDSQPISGLLIASALASGPISLEVTNPGETPWVAMTLHWFDKLGIPYKSDRFLTYHLPGNARYKGFEYHVPGDISSASFPLAAAIVTHSELTIGNVDIEDPQGDRELIAILQKMGAHIEIDAENEVLRVKKTGALQGTAIDINSCIDTLPILAVIACFAKGETHIYNAEVARTKECDRVACIARELRKMGASIEETKDGLKIRGTELKGASLSSHHDHRMAMALTVAALGAYGESTISSVECIAKSYPTFIEDFKRVGAPIVPATIESGVCA